MAATPEEIGILAAIGKWLWTPFAGLGAWVWSRIDRRFEQMEKLIAGKADKEEVENHRKDIKELFGRIDGLKEDLADKHVELLKAIHESRK